MIKTKSKDKKRKDTIPYEINFIIDFSDEHCHTITNYIDISKTKLIIKNS